MIGSSRQVRVFAYAAPADMRKGFEGLSALVREGLGRDPLSGDLFLFVNRTRKRAKVLLWDGTGLCVYAKRLEKPGRFACLWRDRSFDDLELTVTELQLFLEGSALVGRVELSPSILGEDALAVRESSRTFPASHGQDRSDQGRRAAPPSGRTPAARKRGAAAPARAADP